MSSGILEMINLIVSVAISYASEICPVALRGYLTTWGNSCWGIGQLLAIAVIKSMFSRDDQWAYRIPYGLQVCFMLSFPSLNRANCLLVDVVPASYHWRLFHPRVSMVAGSQRTI